MILMREIGTERNAGPFRKPKSRRVGRLGLQTAEATTAAGVPSFAALCEGRVRRRHTQRVA
jgi:hypothetical protein